MNFVGVNRLFLLVYSNEDDNSERFKAKRYYLPKGIIDNYNVIFNGKNFYNQPIDSDIKRYEEIRNKIKIFSKKCSSVIDDGKLSKSES